MGSVTFQLILLVFYVLLSNIFFQKPVDPYYYEKNLRPHRVVALIMYFPRDSVTKQRHGIPRVKCISLNVGGWHFSETVSGGGRAPRTADLPKKSKCAIFRMDSISNPEPTTSKGRQNYLFFAPKKVCTSDTSPVRKSRF